MFSTAYFGLFRIGEITQSPHVLKAIDVHTGVNKKKMMFVLHSSKTHNKGMKPQIIKITSTELRNLKHNNKNMEQYCPFAMLTDFIQLHKRFKDEQEQFFIFVERSPVTSTHFRKTLIKSLKWNRFDYRLYS